jgi:hypothetical protein
VAAVLHLQILSSAKFADVPVEMSSLLPPCEEIFCNDEEFSTLRFERDSPFQHVSDALSQAVDERTAAASHVQSPTFVRQTIQPFQFRQNLSPS